MSIQPAPHTEGYARPDDLVDFFDKYGAFLDSDEVYIEEDDEVKQKSDVDLDTIEDPDNIGPTNPSRDHVERRIRAESDWIDNYTAHAWRPRQVVEEHLSLTANYYWRAGTPLKLQKRQIIAPFDSSKGDKLETWSGSSGDGWHDWIADPEQDYGRDDDYWVEVDTGMLYIYRFKMWFNRHKEIRVTYRYGREWPDPADNDTDLPDEEFKRQNVPQMIRDACARRVAAHYLESQQYRVTTPGNEEAPDDVTIAERWREIAKSDLEQYREVRTLGNQ